MIVDLIVSNQLLFFVGLEIILPFQKFKRIYLCFWITFSRILIFVIVNASSVIIMRAVCILPHFGPFSLINLFIKFWLVTYLLLFLDYLFTFNIDDDAAFWLSYALGETSLKDPSECLKKLERFGLRATGETEGCDNYFTSNFYSLFRYWLKNLLFGNLLKYGSWVNLFNWPRSEGEKGGLKTFCLISLEGVGNMSDNKYKTISRNVLLI